MSLKQKNNKKHGRDDWAAEPAKNYGIIAEGPAKSFRDKTIHRLTVL